MTMRRGLTCAAEQVNASSAAMKNFTALLYVTSEFKKIKLAAFQVMSSARHNAESGLGVNQL